MEMLIAQLLVIVRRMWKYRWIGLAVAWVTGLVGAVVVFVLPDRYEASARIYVDTQSILKPLMSGLAVQPNVEQQLTMLSRTLISRPNVEKLVRMADLDLKNQSKAQQEATIETVTSNLSIQTSGRDNLYILGYRDSDPETAKRVVQSLVSIFVESSLSGQRKDTSTATAFITEQIKAYETKLEEAETRLKEFRLRNLANMKDGKDSASNIAELSTLLERARLEYREATNARDAAKAQLEAEKNRPGSSMSTAQSLLQEANAQVSTPELDARLAELRRNLDGLLQRFTDQHPDIISTRKLIKDLEDQRKREIAELRKAAMSTPSLSPAGGGNPAMQELVRIVATTEVQVAALRARVDEYSSRYAAALGAMKTAPQIEAEAAQLNRDYAIQKKNYEDLVMRREQAAMSGELDVASGVADFRVIDPPRANPKPVAPNRLLLLASSMAAALGVGLFTTFAASQLRPVFHDANDLRARVELPILGVVTRLVTDADRARNRVDLIRFSAGAGGLLVVFAIALTILAVQLSRQVVT